MVDIKLGAIGKFEANDGAVKRSGQEIKVSGV